MTGCASRTEIVSRKLAIPACSRAVRARSSTPPTSGKRDERGEAGEEGRRRRRRTAANPSARPRAIKRDAEHDRRGTSRVRLPRGPLCGRRRSCRESSEHGAIDPRPAPRGRRPARARPPCACWRPTSPNSAHRAKAVDEARVRGAAAGARARGATDARASIAAAAAARPRPRRHQEGFAADRDLAARSARHAAPAPRGARRSRSAPRWQIVEADVEHGRAPRRE